MPAPRPRSTSPPSRLARFRRSELPYDTQELARFLIGAYLVSVTAGVRLVARIVETEAYLPGDPASHAFRGPTPRNRAMFGARGYAYVYFIYGNHYCLNVTAAEPGVGAAVLLRAAEPVAGLAVMRERRRGAPERDLLRGPGRLAEAFGVGASIDGVDLCAAGPLWLGRPNGATPAIVTGPRVGITKNASAPLRYCEAGNRFVSGPKPQGALT